MRKRKRKVGIGFKIFAFLLMVVSILLSIDIVFINVLSNMLLVLVIGLILLIDVLCIYLLLGSRVKKLGLIVSSIFIFLFSFVNVYLDKAVSVFDNFSLDYKTYNYSIIVLNNSDYKKLSSLDNRTLGYYNDNSEEGDKALDKVVSNVGLTLKEFDDINNLRDSLLDEEVDAILLERSYLEILNENILIDNSSFREHIKEIYDFKIRVKNHNIAVDLNVTKEPFNVYISGIDTFGEISSVSRSDVNMIVSVNPSTNQVLLTSIPRDFYVKLYNKTGYRDKITHAGLYGVDTSIKTIEELLDIEINYYVKVNFSSVVNIVNAIDGVSVNSDYDFTSIDNIHYSKGVNELNGEEALSFARERKAFLLGDRQRVKNQQALFKGIIDKCLSPSIIKNYSKLMNSIEKSFVTNMKISRITSLIKMQLSRGDNWNIISNSLNGIDHKDYTYSAPNTSSYVMLPVGDSVDYGISLINKVLDGEILDKSVIEEEQKEITRLVNVASITGIVDASVEVNKNKDDDEEEVKEELKPNVEEESKVDDERNINDEEKSKLNVSLVRPNFEFVYGDEYIYHGVVASYGNEDITNDRELEINFRVGINEFDNYSDLIYYMSKQESGNYVVNYIIKFKKEEVVLNQIVTIKDSLIDEDVSDNIEDESDDLIDE